MAHIRTHIRQAVAQRLMGLPTTGNRVFTSRVYPMERAALPGLTIATQSDELNPDRSALNNGNLTLGSRLQLLITVYTQSKDRIDDILDQVELEICQALMSDSTLGSLVNDINWHSTEITFEGLGEQPIGVSRQLFVVDYRINERRLDE